jgi:hypothetical protein
MNTNETHELPRETATKLAESRIARLNYLLAREGAAFLPYYTSAVVCRDDATEILARTPWNAAIRARRGIGYLTGDADNG